MWIHPMASQTKGKADSSSVISTNLDLYSRSLVTSSEYRLGVYVGVSGMLATRGGTGKIVASYCRYPLFSDLRAPKKRARAIFANAAPRGKTARDSPIHPPPAMIIPPSTLSTLRPLPHFACRTSNPILIPMGPGTCNAWGRH